MDGIHDLGGKQGFGPVDRSTPAKAFGERWEGAVFTMTRAARACGALANTDQFRFAVERIDPVAYLTHGYYGRWLGAVEELLVEAGVITSAELEARVREKGGDVNALVAARPDPNMPRVAPDDDGSAVRPLASAPRFAVGDAVRTSAAVVSGHCRLPAYARNRLGTISAQHQGWVFPDSNAHGRGEQPTHLYTVAFRGEALWGGEAEPGLVVHLDLFEPYLSPA